MGWLTDPLALELFQRALIEAVLMGATCGAIGAYVVLRRLAFIGDALSHAVFPGVVLAYITGTPIFAGAMMPGTITSVAIAVVGSRPADPRGHRHRHLLRRCVQLGIVLISTQAGYQRDLSAFLVGNLLDQLGPDRRQRGGGGNRDRPDGRPAQGAAADQLDRVTQGRLGYQVCLLELLLLLLLTATIVVSLAAVGIILVLAMLVTPAATARLLVDRFTPMMILGAALGALYGIVGWYVSYHLGWSPGGSIVLVATASFVVAFVLSPSHGVLAHRLRRHPQHAAQRAAVDPPAGHRHGEGEVPW